MLVIAEAAIARKVATMRTDPYLVVPALTAVRRSPVVRVRHRRPPHEDHDPDRPRHNHRV
jgi:hypothetical protein